MESYMANLFSLTNISYHPVINIRVVKNTRGAKYVMFFTDGESNVTQRDFVMKLDKV